MYTARAETRPKSRVGAVMERQRDPLLKLCKLSKEDFYTE